MASLGDAYLTVRADTAPFLADIEELKKVIAAQAALKLKVSSTPASGTGGSNSTNSFAAANAAAIRDLKQTARDLASAESEAYREAAQMARDAAADIDKSFSSAGGSVKGFSADLHDLKIPAIVAAVSIAAIAAAAVAAAGAIGVLGVKSAETLRSLTLQLTDAGDSAQQAKVQIQALQALAAQGLDLSALAADQSTIQNLGLSAQQATALLQNLANVFAGEGFVGAALQTQVDAASKALATAVSAGNATKSTIGNVADALGVSQASIRHELGLTQTQLDKLVASGKLSGAQVANAGVAAADALKNSQNGLATALANSPTQALDALKSKLEAAVAGAFAGPGVASGIDKLGDQLVSSAGAVAPRIATLASEVLTGLSEAVGPVTQFLEGALGDIAGLFEAAVDPSSALHGTLVTLGDDLADIAKIAVPLFEGIGGAIAGVLIVAKPFLDALAEIADTKAGQIAFEVAAGITAIGLATKVVTGVNLLTGSLRALTGAEEGAALASAGLSTGGIAVLAAGAFYAGDKIVNLTAHLLGYQSAAEQLAAITKQAAAQFPALAQGFQDAGIPVSDLAIAFGALNTANANHVSQAQGVIDALEKQGLSAGDAQTALEKMGVDASAAYNAVNSANFNQADFELSALTDSALQAAGQLAIAGAQAQAAYSALNGGLFGPIEKQQGVDSLAGKTQATVNAGALAALKAPTFSGGGGSGTSAAASAKKAIADATATFKTSLGDFTAAIGGAQTVAAVDSAFKALQSAIDAEDKALGRSEPKGLKTYLAAQKAILDKSASEIALGLSERTQFLADATVGAANPNVAGVSGIISQLQGQLARSTEFAKDLKTLQKEGLNSTALNQLLAVGPTSAGLQAASDLIQATASQISTINGIQSQIGSAGEGLGISLASNFKTAGQESAAGLIDGLTSAIPAIETAAAKVAKAIDTKFKDALGIKSPSTVFAGHGESIVAGLAQGLARAPIPGVPAPTLSRLAGAGGLGNGNVNNFEITVNNADSSDPRGTGNVIGMAIADVLAARQMNQTFARN